MKKRAILILILIIAIILAVLFYRQMTGRVITSMHTCSDTDLGKNYELKGEIMYGINSQNANSLEDKCLSKSVLLEQYCSYEGINSYPGSVEYECLNGCSDGRCNPSITAGAPAPARICNLLCRAKRIIGLA